MSGRISNLLSHTFIYGLGNLLSKGIMFLMVPILTNTMVPDEFGKLNIVQPFIGFAEVFFMLGMRQAILRYAVKHEYTRSEVFTAGVNWISVATLISLTILILFSTFFNSFSKINNMEIYRNMMIILVLDAFANAP
ncbi:MAG: oligosaccharide flippase family protein, partial [Fibrobacteres bacterium]|nr:oligosaccharide flippase family protein [Fibrobacterota bacterium]